MTILGRPPSVNQWMVFAAEVEAATGQPVLIDTDSHHWNPILGRWEPWLQLRRESAPHGETFSLILGSR